jgi:hypothetical protein
MSIPEVCGLIFRFTDSKRTNTAEMEKKKTLNFFVSKHYVVTSTACVQEQQAHNRTSVIFVSLRFLESVVYIQGRWWNGMDHPQGNIGRGVPYSRFSNIRNPTP